MDVMNAAAAREQAGHHIIHMEVGQPGTPAPETARNALRNAIDTDNLGYTLALGSDSLRRRIARHYRDSYDVEVDPARIIVTSGSSGAFILAFTALFDAGARIALPSPGYPCYRHILTTLDLVPELIETSANGRWMPTSRDIEEADLRSRLAGILVASPANPTGTMLEPTRLSELVETSRRLGLWFISDEIYHGLTYEVPAATALAYSQDAIVINSFSKYFSMTGWRVGWMVVPERCIRVFERLAQNLFICAPSASQAAALGAFDGGAELEANKRTYAVNRDLLLRELPKAGFDKIVPADGAFYLYCDISDFGLDSPELCRRILDDAGVAITPGVDFDPVRGGRYVRFSYARATPDIVEAARRLIAWRQTFAPAPPAAR
ncbi:MAG: 1-aminocyclopropane-1-carboxylate deaminase [Alphaproteobacteria bacterium BRH_c36]|nr:MAG: 1-aminocyclopropane-1-carboxylate deaminase [Alphaproteobacteria bacterium BRH_c36]